MLPRTGRLLLLMMQGCGECIELLLQLCNSTIRLLLSLPARLGDDTLPSRLRAPLAWDFGMLWILITSNLQAATCLTRPGSLLLVASIAGIGASGIVRVHNVVAFRTCLSAVLSAMAI
jgi:hypothetical protein